MSNYKAVTGAYWGFTLTDGALRMLVLLYFHNIGFSPLDLAYLFLLYEFMGIPANLLGGWLGAIYGVRRTLFIGLSLQIFTLFFLSFLNVDWGYWISVIYVMGAQALSGIAKDLTKMSSKTAVKSVVKDQNVDQQEKQLFKWVAILTGSKNALKGVGFFIGAALLALLGFQGALWAMALALGGVLIFSVLKIEKGIGQAKKKVKIRHLFADDRNINLLSAARICLFSARDVWFVVAVPIFLGTHLGWSHYGIGAFMACWVIGYGIIQAIAPKILHMNTAKKVDIKENTRAIAIQKAKIYIGILALIPVAIVGAFGGEVHYFGMSQAIYISTVLMIGLFVFGAVFAFNSALHSYLIVSFSDMDKISLNVGFYYMANAIGRLLGTILSGLTYQFYGIEGSLIAASLLLLFAFLISLFLKENSIRIISEVKKGA